MTRLIIIALVFGLFFALPVANKPTKKELIQQLKLRDFYLVYQYYFDEDLIKLRQEIQEFP